MFTRKHYQVIAEIIANTKLTQPDYKLPISYVEGVMAGNDEARKEIAGKLANYFAEDNSRFDRDKFIAACQV